MRAAVAVALCLGAAAALGQTARVVLRWKAASGAASYELQISKDPQFTAVLVKQTVTQPAWRWEELPADTYYWRVRALDAEGRASEWSEARVINPATGTPVVLSPGASVVCSFEAQPFTLQPSPVIKQYVLEVASDARFSSDRREVRGPGPTLSVPALAAGNWWWRVWGVDLEGRATDKSPARALTVTLGTPTLKGPSEAAMGTSVTLRWTDVACATGWRVELVRDGVETLKLDAPGPSQAFHPASSGDYRWKVAAVDFRGVSSPFSAEALLKVRLGAPTLKGESPGPPVELTWGPVPQATGYRLELSNTDDFKPVLQQPVVAGTSWHGELAPGRYAWRVAARDANGHFSQPSPPRHFELGEPARPTALAMPVLAPPSFSGEATTLRWTAVSGATHYDVWLWFDGGVEDRREATAANATWALQRGPWQVAVRALGADGAQSDFTAPLSFTVGEGAVVDATPPPAPAVAGTRWRLGAFFGGRFNGAAIASPTGAVSFSWHPAWYSVEARLGGYGTAATLPQAVTAHAQLVPLAVLVGAAHWFGAFELRGALGPALQLSWAQLSTGSSGFAALPGFEVLASAGYALGPGLLSLALSYLYGRLDTRTARLNAGGIGVFLGYAVALPLGGG